VTDQAPGQQMQGPAQPQVVNLNAQVDGFGKTTARKLTQRAAGDLQSQLTFTHTAHAGEQHPTARRADQLKELLQLLAAPHKAAGIDAAIGEVVGGVEWVAWLAGFPGFGTQPTLDNINILGIGYH
jgi:hypothetical protein